MSPADIDSNYGRTLGIKLLLAAPVFILGAWQHIALRPQLVARLGLRAGLGRRKAAAAGSRADAADTGRRWPG